MDEVTFSWVDIDLLPIEAGLIGRVQAGEISPSEAEAQRQKAGRPPLAGWTDPAGFDPRQKINWSLPMALAWIIWRSIDAVREEMPDYRRQSTFWNSRGAGTEGSPTQWLLEHKRPRSVHSVVSTAHVSTRVQVAAAGSAEDKLLRMLQDASSGLTATGLPAPGARRDLITADEWEDMTPCSDDRHHDGAWAQGAEPRWYEVRVKSADVMRLWDKDPIAAPIAAEAPVTEEDVTAPEPAESAPKPAATEAAVEPEVTPVQTTLTQPEVDPDETLRRKIEKALNNDPQRGKRRQPKRFPLKVKILLRAAKGEDVDGRSLSSPAETDRAASFNADLGTFRNAVRELNDNGLLEKFSNYKIL